MRNTRDFINEIVPDEFDISYALETLMEAVNNDDVERICYFANSDKELEKAELDLYRAVEQIKWCKAMKMVIDDMDRKIF